MFVLSATTRHATKGYTLSLSVDSDSQRRPETLLQLELSRTVAHATQLQFFTFKLPTFTCGIELTCSPVATGQRMGRYGRVSVRFVPRTRPVQVPVDFPSCTGRKTQRSGDVVGTVWLKPHNAALPAYHGRFRLPATVSSETIYTCGEPTSTCHVAGISAIDDSATRYFVFVASAEGTPESAIVHVGHKISGLRWGTVGHTVYYDHLPPTAFSADPAQTRAHVDSTGLPFLSGSAEFSADAGPPVTADSSCGTGTQTSGSATGDLTVQFDGVAPTPLVPTNAVLWRRP
jgi:hypothetical protein